MYVFCVFASVPPLPPLFHVIYCKRLGLLRLGVSIHNNNNNNVITIFLLGAPINFPACVLGQWSLPEDFSETYDMSGSHWILQHWKNYIRTNLRCVLFNENSVKKKRKRKLDQKKRRKKNENLKMPEQKIIFEGFRPEWCISTIYHALRYTILAANPRYTSIRMIPKQSYDVQANVYSCLGSIVCGVYALWFGDAKRLDRSLGSRFAHVRFVFLLLA